MPVPYTQWSLGPQDPVTGSIDANNPGITAKVKRRARFSRSDEHCRWKPTEVGLVPQAPHEGTMKSVAATKYPA